MSFYLIIRISIKANRRMTKDLESYKGENILKLITTLSTGIASVHATGLAMLTRVWSYVVKLLCRGIVAPEIFALHLNTKALKEQNP